MPEAAESTQPFTLDAIRQLQEYTWPGNIRELANVVEHASILCDALPIDRDDLPLNFDRAGATIVKFETGGLSLRDIEMQAIHTALDRHNGNKTAAAQELGVSLKTLYNKLNQEAVRKAA